MRVKTTYILYIILIHIAMIGILFWLYREQKGWYLLVEIIAVISIIIAFNIYKKLIKPIELMEAGVAAIEDQDFQLKFNAVRSGDVGKLIQVYNNMIDRLRVERIKNEEKQFFLGQLMDASQMGVIITDYDQNINYTNAEFRKLFEIATDKDLESLFQRWPILLEVKPGEEKVISISHTLKLKVQRGQFIENGFKRTFYLFTDLSRELLASEKTAYAKVIRMMAHEVNNSIGAINSILQSTLEIQKDAQDIDVDVVESLEVAIERNDMLNGFMRNFAKILRLPEPTKKQEKLQQICNHVLQLNKIKAANLNIELSYNYPLNTVWVLVDRQQIEQVLLNVVKNAMEAIDHDNGKISIRIHENPLQLTISDNGKGISDEKAEKLFTPFYSDKVNGQGIGLTLAKEILINHKMDFSLQTKDGFTTFLIEFP